MRTSGYLPFVLRLSKHGGHAKSRVAELSSRSSRWRGVQAYAQTRQGDTNRHFRMPALAKMTQFVLGGRSIGDRSALRPLTGGAQNPSMESPCDSCAKTLLAGRLSLITVRKYCFECPHGYVPSRFSTLTVAGDIRSCRRILASVATPANSETPPPVLAGA